jgi:hypothetical protein
MYTKHKTMTLFLVLLLSATAAYAETVDFNLSGTFTDLAELGGMLTLDTTAGHIIAANVTVGPPDSLQFNVILYDNSNGPYWLTQLWTSAGSGGPSLSLVLPTQSTTLSGYQGGPLCSLSALCGPSNNVTSGLIFAPGVTTFLLDGTASLVPETGTLLLLLTSAPAMVIACRRRYVLSNH